LRPPTLILPGSLLLRKDCASSAVPDFATLPGPPRGQFLWFATLPMEATLLWLPTMTVTSMHGGRALRMIS
jgi:hypothetical protein